MPKQKNIGWGLFDLGAGVTAFVALIATSGTLPKWAVILLGFLTAAFFSAGVIQFGWTRKAPYRIGRWVKGTFVHGIIWAVVIMAGWAVWPPSPSPTPTDSNITLYDLYKTDFNGSGRNCGQGQQEFSYPNPNNPAGEKLKGTLFATLCFDWGSKAKFLAFYIPGSYGPMTADIVALIGRNYGDLGNLKGFSVDTKSPGDTTWESSKDFRFSGKVYVYHEYELTYTQLASLERLFAENKMTPIFRGIEYLQVQELERAIPKPQAH